jgi:hypothetical protein
MKRNLLLLSVLAVVLVPHAASAFVGGGEVIRLSNNVFMSVETISLTAESEVVTVPVTAVPQMRPGTSDSFLKYRTLLDGQGWAGLDTYAAVISQAALDGNRYVLDKSETADFTFIALLVLPAADTVRPDLAVSFDVTSFPVTGEYTTSD